MRSSGQSELAPATVDIGPAALANLYKENDEEHFSSLKQYVGHGNMDMHMRLRRQEWFCKVMGKAFTNIMPMPGEQNKE